MILRVVDGTIPAGQLEEVRVALERDYVPTAMRTPGLERFIVATCPADGADDREAEKEEGLDHLRRGQTVGDAGPPVMGADLAGFVEQRGAIGRGRGDRRVADRQIDQSPP